MNQLGKKVVVRGGEALLRPQSTYRGRVETGKGSVLSAGAYTTVLYVMVDRVKGVGGAPPTLTSLG